MNADNYVNVQRYAAGQKACAGQNRGLAIGGECAETALPPSEFSQIDSCMNRLTTLIAHLNEAVGVLEDRLAPVLDPAPTVADSSNTAAPVPVRCPMGASLDTKSDAVHYATTRLHDLLNRLAV
jgi:hypothetical protein